MPDAFKNMFGSTCGVHYDNMIWFIVHTNKQRNYSHAFVVFDQKMNLIKYSAWFKYETTREFCYGLLIENNEFIIAYSTDNSTTNVAIYDYEYIKNDILWNIV
jgi:hypothetical protein